MKLLYISSCTFALLPLITCSHDHDQLGSILPTTAPTLQPTGTAISVDNKSLYTVSFDDWKLYAAIGLLIMLCVSIFSLVVCCARMNRLRKITALSTQSHSVGHSLRSQIGNNRSITRTYSPRSITTPCPSPVQVSEQLQSSPNTTTNLAKVQSISNDNVTEESSVTFEPFTRHISSENIPKKRKSLKRYKTKLDKIEKVEFGVQNSGAYVVNKLSFDHDLNPVLYTQTDEKFGSEAEGRKHSIITESSTFTLKSHSTALGHGVSEEHNDFKVFRNDLKPLAQIESEVPNVTETKGNHKLPRKITAGAWL